MKIISTCTIGKLIIAHIEKDEAKFFSYANFIADAYEEAGENIKANYIRKIINGTYNKDSLISSSEGEYKDE